MQVLQLSDEQIAMLPPDQRQSILILKDQIARSANKWLWNNYSNKLFCVILLLKFSDTFFIALQYWFYTIFS